MEFEMWTQNRSSPATYQHDHEALTADIVLSPAKLNLLSEGILVNSLLQSTAGVMWYANELQLVINVKKL